MYVIAKDLRVEKHKQWKMTKNAANDVCFGTQNKALKGPNIRVSTKKKHSKAGRTTGFWENDDEEAMLEEMLNAESGGYGEFEDDYDNNMNEDDKDDANFQEDEGNDEDEGDDEDDEGVSLFGKPKEKDEPNSKRIKTNC